MRNEFARIGLDQALGHALQHVEVIEDFVEGAVVRKLVEQIPNGLLRFHDARV